MRKRKGKSIENRKIKIKYGNIRIFARKIENFSNSYRELIAQIFLNRLKDFCKILKFFRRILHTN